jgi:hypothetical protein
LELRIVGTTDDPVPVIPPIDAEPDIDFDTFWSCYPRKVAKKDAHRAWDRINKTEHAAIMAALWCWRRYWDARADPEYIMYAATYLNGERWTDELPAEYQYRPPRVAAVPAQEQAKGERVPMPDHIRQMIAKMKGGKQ